MSEEILLDRFDSWTEGLDKKQARIALFERIRDIPYYLAPQIDNPYAWAVAILDQNKGSCSPKHYLLGFFFTKLGLAVKYASYPFRWENQGLDYPPDLKKLSRGLPVVYHVACKVKIEDKWVLVDATWDISLAKAGFTVNKDWDGVSDTLNAVLPVEEILHSSLEERLDFVRDKKKSWSQQDKEAYAKFTERFNFWLESLR